MGSRSSKSSNINRKEEPQIFDKRNTKIVNNGACTASRYNSSKYNIPPSVNRPVAMGKSSRLPLIGNETIINTQPTRNIPQYAKLTLKPAVIQESKQKELETYDQRNSNVKNSGEHESSKSHISPSVNGSFLMCNSSKLTLTGNAAIRNTQPTRKILLPLPVKSVDIQEENVIVPFPLREKLKRLYLTIERRKNVSGSLTENKAEVFFQDVNNSHHEHSLLSKVLLNDLETRRMKSNFIEMQEYRQKLPAYQQKKKIIEIIENNQVIVLSGATGCGKTTQVPQFILDSYILSGKGSECRVVCTQPRKISAIGVAERVAAERCVPCGDFKDVGYHVRLQRKIPRNFGSILFCTTGIMLVQLQFNPYLSGISHIIVDEVHERDLLSDFFLMILRDILCKNKSLKVILMSATVDAKVFSAYFGNCPVIEIPGRMHPVEVFYLEDILEITGYRSNLTPKHQPQNVKKDPEYEREKRLYISKISPRYSVATISSLHKWNEDQLNLDLILDLIMYIVSNKKKNMEFQRNGKVNLSNNGSILVFLPGIAEIQNLFQRLQFAFPSKRKFLVIPLHSQTSSKYHRQVLEKAPNGVRKIILSTNIAETSITIDDCTVVIDSGKLKLKDFDPVGNMHVLSPQWVALSNAKQRRGRAGRTQPGVCYHLFTSFKETKLDDFQLPEIQRSSLEEIILSMKLLKKDNVRMYFGKTLSPPKPEAVEVSMHFLRDLNAITAEEELTPLGLLLAKLPVDVHIGKMLLFSALFSCLDPISTIAACLSFKDPFQFAMRNDEKIQQWQQKLILSENSQSDHLLFVNIMEQLKDFDLDSEEFQLFCKENFLTQSTLKMLDELKHQYARYLHQLHFIGNDDPYDSNHNQNSDNKSLIKSIICAALYPNLVKVCIRDSDEFRRRHLPVLRAQTKHGDIFHVHPKSINAFAHTIDTGWLCYYLKMRSTKIFMHDTTKVHPHCMLMFASQVKAVYTHYSYLIMDDWIKFYGNRQDLDLVMLLRNKFNEVFTQKIFNPSITDWSNSFNEIEVLQCVMNFIS